MFHLPPWARDYFPVANARYGRSCLGDDDTVSSTDRRSSEGLPGNGKPAVFRIKTTWLLSNHWIGEHKRNYTRWRWRVAATRTWPSSATGVLCPFPASVHRVTPASSPFHHLHSQHAALRSVICHEMSVGARWRAFTTDFVVSFPRWSDRSTIWSCPSSSSPALQARTWAGWSSSPKQAEASLFTWVVRRCLDLAAAKKRRCGLDAAQVCSAGPFRMTVPEPNDLACPAPDWL